MNLTTLFFLVVGIGLFVGGFYLIHPPLALIAGGLVSAALAALFWEVEDG